MRDTNYIDTRNNRIFFDIYRWYQFITLSSMFINIDMNTKCASYIKSKNIITDH